MTQAERTLLEHRHAVRANLPTDVRHAAQVAEHAVIAARYARLDPPAEVLAAAETLARWAADVARKVAAERAELAHTGTDRAEHQRDLERRATNPNPTTD